MMRGKHRALYNPRMRAVVISKEGKPVWPNVKVVPDWIEPTAGPGEVVVRTEASALNQLDLHVGRGMPGLGLTYPRISGSDGAGIVESVGAGVNEAWIGKRVLLNAQIPRPDPLLPGAAPAADDRIMIGEHMHGTLAAKFVAPVANLLDIGDADPVQAAAFGLTHLTAWRMMRSRANAQPGQWLLITGIGGGVALAALNIARHLACRTIVTSRHQWKLDRAMDLGADFAVLDTGDDWSKAVRSHTAKRGVDVVIDSIGKAAHLPALKSLARGGAYVTCGATAGADATTDLARVFWSQLSILGSTMGDMCEFREVVSLFRRGAIAPVIDSTFEAADAPQAYARLESGDQFGKIVVRWV
jgi:NADPH:quinone reductase-like Zn-dependent oxidoreductase